MKYCNSCGQTMRDRARKCPNCGAKTDRFDKDTNLVYQKPEDLQPYQSSKDFQPSPKQQGVSNKTQSPLMSQKISLLFVLFFPPGLAQIIVGKRKRGLVFMSITLILIIIAVVVPLSTSFYQTIYFLNPLVTVLLIWGTVDAFKRAKKLNMLIHIL